MATHKMSLLYNLLRMALLSIKTRTTSPLPIIDNADTTRIERSIPGCICYQSMKQHASNKIIKEHFFYLEAFSRHGNCTLRLPTSTHCVTDTQTHSRSTEQHNDTTTQLCAAVQLSAMHVINNRRGALSHTVDRPKILGSMPFMHPTTAY